MANFFFPEDSGCQRECLTHLPRLSLDQRGKGGLALGSRGRLAHELLDDLELFLFSFPLPLSLRPAFHFELGLKATFGDGERLGALAEFSLVFRRVSSSVDNSGFSVDRS